MRRPNHPANEELNPDFPKRDNGSTASPDRSREMAVPPAPWSNPAERPKIHRDPLTGSTWEHRNGFEILHLYGNPYERGSAHGRLLREKIRASRVAEYYGQFVDKLYQSSDFIQRIPRALRPALGRMMEWWYYAPLERLCMDETRAEIEGVADGAEIDPRLTLRGVLAPDVQEALAAGFLKSGKQSLGNYYLGGCSTAYARREACANQRRTYFTRNMDFPGVFTWRYPTIVFAHPTEHVETLVRDEGGSFIWQTKRKQPYMYITTAGFPGFGLTGMNASGVAMGTFVCLSQNVGGRSRLFLDYNHYLFTRAECVDGIEQIVRTERPTSVTPHTVVYAAADDALTIEVDSRQVSAKRLGPDFDILAQTNHYSNPRLKRREIEYPLLSENSIGRHRFVLDALQESYGRLDAQRMVDIASGNVDLAGKRSGLLGDFPAQPVTLTSVVFELGRGEFWLAGGVPPAVCYNIYYGFDFYDELRGGGSSRRLRSYSQSPQALFKEVDYRPVTDNMKESLRRVMLSQELLKQGKRKHAIRHLRAGIELHTDPGYRYILGILLLADGECDEALSIFESLDRPFLFPHVKESALRLWKARALSLLDRRPEALRVYRDLLADGNLAPQLRRAVRRELRGRFVSDRIPASFDYALLGPLLF